MILNILLSNKQRSIAACLFFPPIIFILWLSSVAWAQDQPNFPNLTGRVTDQASLLNNEQKAELDQKLAAHEAATSNQIVVVTVKSLEGLDIADYALKLGRKWGIGTEDKDNGVLLVVAPNERKVRIEVGYGLEGALPDGLAGTIVRNNILPSFRESEYPKGISNGVTAIEEAIRGEYTPPVNASDNKRRSGKNSSIEKFFPLFFIGFIGLTHALKRYANRRVTNAAFPASFAGLVTALGSSNLIYGGLAAVAVFLLVYLISSDGNGSSGNRRNRHRSDDYAGSRSRSSSSGGFSGGGGGFGGGGASGSW